ncbi:MAG: hypothetical protein J7L79_02035 [Thaumarchaeota archaeon]|nr:hypothetical protein [Nitrososphaerota archaeon]
MRQKALLLLLALLVFAASLHPEPVNALSKPVYPPQKYPQMIPNLMAVHGSQLIVQDLSEKAVELISLETWETRSLKIGKELSDLAILGDLLAIAPRDKRLLIYDLKTGEQRELEVPERIEDLEAGGGLIWASIPLQDLILGINPISLEVEKRIELDIASGRGKLSIAGGSLWAVEEAGESVVRIDLESGSKSSLKLEESAVTIKAFEDGALVATNGDKILEISSDLKVRRSWSLEKGSATEIQIYRLEDGRIIYVSPSRWIIGEIEGDEITEVKTEARIGGSALAEDRIWFSEPTKMRIGYAPLSRPPKITEFRIEKVDGNLFKAYAEVDDPDGDLAKVYLIVFYPELVGSAQNRSYEMNLEDGSYVKEFRVDYGRRAEVHVSAVDRFNNLGESETILVKAEELKTITSQQTTQTGQGASITPAEIYALGSSLLLLLPIIMALAYLHGRRRKKRRRI